MKNISLILCFLLNAINTFSQKSITLDPSVTSLNTPYHIVKSSGDGLIHRSAFGNGYMGSYASLSAYLETKNNNNLYFTTNNNGNFDVTLFTNGTFGIDSDIFSVPQAKLEVNGFTKLGLNAPAIKTKLYSGTTAGAQNQGTSFAHGLVASKILAIKVMVNLGLAGNVSENYTINNGFQIGVSFENTLIYVWNSPANSSLALNKPYTVLVTYEE